MFRESSVFEPYLELTGHKITDLIISRAFMESLVEEYKDMPQSTGSASQTTLDGINLYIKEDIDPRSPLRYMYPMLMMFEDKIFILPPMEDMEYASYF